MADILVVDDDQSVASAFESFLSFDGHTCRLASNAEEAMHLIAARRPALVMMDVRMPGVDGLSALKQIRSAFPDIYVVMMTGYGTSQTSIDAIRSGAYDYLTKPIDLEEIRAVIRKALEAQQIRTSAEGAAVATAEALPRLVGSTPAMRDVYKTIGRLAGIDVPALVVGEHGTGKQLVTSAIHENSSRAEHPFKVLDCATLDERSIEQAMFDGSLGTVQLSQVEKLSAALQVRIARALDDTLARHAGADRLTARVIASTESDLSVLAQSGSFNRELHAALSVVTVTLPPLRERGDDIPLLVRHFIQRFNVEFDRAIAGADDRVLAVLHGVLLAGERGRTGDGGQAGMHSRSQRRDHRRRGWREARRAAFDQQARCGVVARGRRAHRAPGATGQRPGRRDAVCLPRHHRCRRNDARAGGAQNHQRQSGEGGCRARRQPRHAPKEDS